jgi:hypothetical protein
VDARTRTSSTAPPEAHIRPHFSPIEIGARRLCEHQRLGFLA